MAWTFLELSFTSLATSTRGTVSDSDMALVTCGQAGGCAGLGRGQVGRVGQAGRRTGRGEPHERGLLCVQLLEEE